MNLRFPFSAALWAVLFLLAEPVAAQKGKIDFRPVDFSSEPLATLPDSLKTYPAVYEFSKSYLESIKEQPLAGMVHTTHSRLRVNTEAGLDQFKTIEFSEYQAEALLGLRVKVIARDGSSKELDMKNLRREDDGKRRVVKLPIDGLEIGGAFEMVLTQASSDADDQTIYVQGNIPILQSFISMRSYEGLVYELKAYNVKATVQEIPVSGMEEVERTAAVGLTMPLKEEAFANETALLGRVDIMLRRVPKSGMTQSWTLISNRLINALLPVDAGDRKAMLKFLKKMGAADKPPLVQIAMLEAYVKKNIYIREGYKMVPFQQMIEKDKTVYEFGLLRYFVNLLEHFQIPYRIGATTERSRRAFDPDAPTYNQLSTWFIYLPDTKAYLFPGVGNYYIGNTYAEAIGQKCLLIKPLVVNEAIGVKTSIDSVGVPDTVSNIHNTYARMKVNLDDQSVSASVKQVIAGYTAPFYRNNFEALSQTELAKVIKEEYLPSGADGAIRDIKLVNMSYDGSVPNQPLIEEYTARLNNAVERIGDELLLNIGWVIGRQVSLPTSAARRYPVDPGPPKIYNRDIVLELPAGYAAAEIKSLNKTISYQAGNVLFRLTVTQEGNTLHIVNREYYHTAVMPPSEFLHYEEVMNAAALLNNLKIVLKKG